ncbi:MAG TPA: tetratricopeptide repeat protein [Blastocatellia bacterium]|nr:tetratricopeptide repeat protein [Blastocatellia bacterium]
MRLSAFVILIILFLISSRAFAQAHRPATVDYKQIAIAAFEEGQNAQQRGDLNSALKHYSNAISADPTLYQAYYQRATALIALNREVEAEADLKRVIELEPTFARAHRALGQILLDRGATDDAKQRLARAIELDPKLAGVRIAYASALIKSGEPQKAIEHLRAAIEMNEQVALAYALAGVAEERTGKSAEAMADYSRAIEMDSNNATAREGRARLLEAQGETAKAIEDYTVAYRAQPSRELALKLAELHTRAGQPLAAIQIYRGLVTERPEDIAARMEMARLMAENGQADEAIKEIEKIIAARPTDSKALTAAGDIYFKDKPDAAAEFYRRAVEADANNNRARVQLAASLVRSMQFEAALPLLNEALKREPANYAAHANLATALFKLKAYPDAAREFIWIVNARPEIAASYFFLAISFDKIGDCAQAYRAYQEFTRRADVNVNKNEIEEANIRIHIIERQIKEGKCKPVVRGKG